MKTTNQETQNNTSTNNSINSKEDTMEKKTVTQSSSTASEQNSKQSKNDEVINLEEKVAEIDNQVLEEIVSELNKKKPRKASSKRRQKVEEEHASILEEKNSIENRILEITNLISNKQRIIPATKNTQEQIIPLTAGEIEILKNKRAECEEVLQKLSIKYNRIELRATSISRIDVSARKANIIRQDARNYRNNMAIKFYQEFENLSDLTANNLLTTNDPRMEKVRIATNYHPQKVNSIWYGILKQELVNHKIGEENLVDLLSSSPTVRARLSKRIAVRFRKDSK